MYGMHGQFFWEFFRVSNISTSIWFCLDEYWRNLRFIVITRNHFEPRISVCTEVILEAIFSRIVINKNSAFPMNAYTHNFSISGDEFTDGLGLATKRQNVSWSVFFFFIFRRLYASNAVILYLCSVRGKRSRRKREPTKSAGRPISIQNGLTALGTKSSSEDRTACFFSFFFYNYYIIFIDSVLWTRLQRITLWRIPVVTVSLSQALFFFFKCLTVKHRTGDERGKIGEKKTRKFRAIVLNSKCSLFSYFIFRI